MFNFDPNDDRWPKRIAAVTVLGVLVEALWRAKYPNIHVLIGLLIAAGVVTLLLQAFGFDRRDKAERSSVFILTTYSSFIFGAILATLLAIILSESKFGVTIQGRRYDLTAAQQQDFTYITAWLIFVVIRMYYAYYATGLMSRLLRRDVGSDIMFPEPVRELLAELEFDQLWMLADSLRTQLALGQWREVLAPQGDWKKVKQVVAEKDDPELGHVVAVVEHLIPKRRLWSLCYDWRQLIDQEFRISMPDTVQKLLVVPGEDEGFVRKKKRRKRKRRKATQLR